MKLSKCTIGKVVIDGEGQIGHIVGLSMNASKEVIPVVRYAIYSISNVMADPIPVHHGNLKEYKER